MQALDFIVTTFHVWREYLNLQFIPIMRTTWLIAVAWSSISMPSASFSALDTSWGSAARWCFARAAYLANFVFVPLVWFLGSHVNMPVYPGTVPVSQMSAAAIYASYVRYVGVGAIATAGILGVIKSLRVISGSFRIAMRVFHASDSHRWRNAQIAMSPMIAILLGIVISAIAVAIFFGNFRFHGRCWAGAFS